MLAISDEIYEHIVYDGRTARADGHRSRDGRSHGDDQRPVEDLQRHRLARRLGDFSAALTGGIRKVHDFLTVGADAAARGRRRRVVAAEAFYSQLAADYENKRDRMLDILRPPRFPEYRPAARTT